MIQQCLFGKSVDAAVQLGLVAAVAYVVAELYHNIVSTGELVVLLQIDTGWLC